MFVETGKLLSYANGLRSGGKDDADHAVTIDVQRLPNYSERVEIVEAREHCFYDRISQRVVRKQLGSIVETTLNKAVQALQRGYLRSKFLYWYNRINRDRINRRTYKRYYPKLIWDNVTDLWAFRKGLQIIVPYYLQTYRRQTRTAFHRWKMHMLEIRALMYRMLGKWRVKASRIRLNRMNARRFLVLTRGLAEKVRRAQRKYHWARFKHACDLVLIRRHVRLLFRCWRTVTEAMRRGRRLVKRRALELLFENVRDERNRYLELQRRCEEIRQRSALRQGYRAWRLAYHNRALFKRVLNSYCQSTLWAAWSTWVRAVQVRPPPSPKPRPPPTPAPMPPREPYTYKRRGSRLPRVPPHIVVPLMGLQSYALVHDPKISPLDRVEFRVHRAARLDLREENREKPDVVELIHHNAPPVLTPVQAAARHSVNHSVGHSTNHSGSHSFTPTTKQGTRHSVGHSTGHSAHHSTHVGTRSSSIRASGGISDISEQPFTPHRSSTPERVRRHVASTPSVSSAVRPRGSGPHGMGSSHSAAKHPATRPPAYGKVAAGQRPQSAGSAKARGNVSTITKPPRPTPSASRTGSYWSPGMI